MLSYHFFSYPQSMRLGSSRALPRHLLFHWGPKFFLHFSMTQITIVQEKISWHLNQNSNFQVFFFHFYIKEADDSFYHVVFTCNGYSCCLTWFRVLLYFIFRFGSGFKKRVRGSLVYIIDVKILQMLNNFVLWFC